MANNYFQFKQFTVWQEHCAMKVCTDACIFGAYIADRVRSQCPVAGNILDIGAGTGLLSLMVAQKTSATFDAVELDEAAFQDAAGNFRQSPWENRLTVFHKDAVLFNPPKKYDCIIANPPFYEGSLVSADQKAAIAKHGATLTLKQLLVLVNKLLSPVGFFTVLLPFNRIDSFTNKALEAGYFLHEQLLVRHTARHPFFRGILIFSKIEKPTIFNELIIKNASGGYTPAFNLLLADYYL